MRTTRWTGLLFWIIIGVGLLTACGFNVSVVAADETLNDSVTIDDQFDVERTGLWMNDPVIQRRIIERMSEGIHERMNEPVGDDNPLSGSEWELQSGFGPTGDIIHADLFWTTIRFDDETLSFRGSDGCNRYDGSYSIDESTITLHPGSRTLGGCGQYGASADAFMDALADVDGINLVNGTSPQDDEMILSGSASELIFAGRKRF